MLYKVIRIGGMRYRFGDKNFQYMLDNLWLIFHMLHSQTNKVYKHRYQIDSLFFI